MEHEQGICPKCGSDGLTYGDTKKQDIAFGFLYVCESCGFDGIEWYNLHFTEHTTPDCNKVPEAVEKPKAPGPVKKDSFMVLSDKIVDLATKTMIPIDRMSLDITLSQVMTEVNRADMLVFIESNEGLTAEERLMRSSSWVMAQVMHDINGFKQEHLSDKPTGFVPRTSGC